MCVCLFAFDSCILPSPFQNLLFLSGELLKTTVLEPLDKGRPIDTVMMSTCNNGRLVIGAQSGVMIVVDNDTLSVVKIFKIVSCPVQENYTKNCA